MSSAPTTFITPEEYLDLERKAERRSEYYQGEIFALAGASPEHVVIVTNLVGELRQHLKKRDCTVYSTDLRLCVSPAGLYTYPDVMVACGKAVFADRRDTLLNPTLIIEVLSESTKNYGRGQKFESYRKLSSLKEYLTISQDKIQIEHWMRQPDDSWILREYNASAETISLPSIGIDLQLSEIYEKIDFSQ